MKNRFLSFVYIIVCGWYVNKSQIECVIKSDHLQYYYSTGNIVVTNTES